MIIIFHLFLRRCNDGTCIPVSNFCNFRKDCADNSDEARCPSKCDFEKDLCGWANVQYYDRLDWTRHQGKTPSNGTGPDVDHTLNTTSGNSFCILYNIFWRSNATPLGC